MTTEELLAMCEEVIQHEETGSQTFFSAETYAPIAHELKRRIMKEQGIVLPGIKAINAAQELLLFYQAWQARLENVIASLDPQSERDARVLVAARKLNDVAKQRNDDCLSGALITPEIDAIHKIILAVRGEKT